MGDLSQIEGIQLTIGNLIGLGVLAGAVGTAVWGVAKIRNNDKEDIEKGYSNAVNRVDTKLSQEVNVLHGRVNKLTDELSDLKYQVGVIEGKTND